MKRVIGVIFGSACGLVLLMGPQVVFAQHRGQGGGGAGRPAGGSDSTDLSDLKRAMALAASPDQIAQFRELTKSTQAAKKSAQEFLQTAAKGDGAALSRNADALSDALAEAQDANQKFLQMFSAGQKSLLKNVTKKLDKANSEITKENKALQASHSDAERARAPVEKIGSALGEFETQQADLANQMGIPAEGAAQKGSGAQ
jgi:chromosome segregation ATPase